MTETLTPAATKVSRINRLCRVILAAIALCALPHTAHAQLTSIHAVRWLTLASPPPGMERLHEDLAGYWRSTRMLVEAPETLDDRIAGRRNTFETREALNIDPRARCARCRLRGDLPQPLAIGLECSDYADKYVGIVRASTADELIRWVKLAYAFNLSAAKPLHIVRALVSGQSSAHVVSPGSVALMKQLLRTDGGFTVLDSDAGLSGDERDSIAWFDLSFNAGSVNGRSLSRLDLKDRFGNLVRRFEVERRPSQEATMRRLVDAVMKARLEDEDIYRIAPPH